MPCGFAVMDNDYWQVVLYHAPGRSALNAGCASEEAATECGIGKRSWFNSRVQESSQMRFRQFRG